MDKSSVSVPTASDSDWVPSAADLDALEQKLSLEALADWEVSDTHLSRSSSRSSIRSDGSGTPVATALSAMATRLKNAEDYLQSSQRSLASEVNQHRSDMRGIQADCENLWNEMAKLRRDFVQLHEQVKQFERDLMWINSEQKRKFDQIAFCTAVCNKIAQGQAIDPNKYKKPKNTPVSYNPSCKGPVSDWV